MSEALGPVHSTRTEREMEKVKAMRLGLEKRKSPRGFSGFILIKSFFWVLSYEVINLTDKVFPFMTHFYPTDPTSHSSTLKVMALAHVL